VAAPELAELADLVRQLAVVHGRVTLSSGKEADYYVDLRRATLHHRASALIGRLVRELTSDWDYTVVGGLTLGADPVATAVMHAPGRPIDAFVVRKSEKTHGLQRRIEGPDVTGRRVLALEDTSTTGTSPLTAVDALGKSAVFFIYAAFAALGIAFVRYCVPETKGHSLEDIDAYWTQGRKWPDHSAQSQNGQGQNGHGQNGQGQDAQAPSTTA